MQFRYEKYKDNLTSFDRNVRLSGILPQGVYRGFEYDWQGAGLNFRLAHIGGETLPNIDQVLSEPMGIWITRQGVVIKEDEPIPLAIESNAGQPLRYDAVIGRHHHDVIYDGGVIATYEILKNVGTSDPNEIGVGGDIDWVILGVLIIPAGAATCENVKYVKPRVPGLGNTKPALLDKVNRFTEQQQEYQSGNIDIININFGAPIGNKSVLLYPNGGNLMIVGQNLNTLDLIADKPNGTELSFLFTQNTTIRNFVKQLKDDHSLAGYTDGYRPIVLNWDDNNDLIINANQIATFKKVNVDGAYAPGILVFGDFWKLVSVSDTPAVLKQQQIVLTAMAETLATINTKVDEFIAQIDSPGSFRSIKLYGNIGDFFDVITGKGLPGNIYKKYQICNGNNDTPDLRDTKVMGYSGLLSDYVGDNAVVGDNFLQLNINNISKFKVTTKMNRNRYRPKGDNGSDLKMWGPDTPPSPGGPDSVQSEDVGADGNRIDLRGERYYTLMLMRLPDNLI